MVIDGCWECLAGGEDRALSGAGTPQWTQRPRPGDINVIKVY